MSLKFFLKEGQNNPQRAKIYLRIIVNRQKAEIATNSTIHLLNGTNPNNAPEPAGKP